MNQESMQMSQRKRSFDDRIVDFKVIHNQKEADFKKFVEIADVHPGHVILDGMNGYGAGAKEIMRDAKERGFVPDIYTLDESTVQIDRARENIPNIQLDHIINGDMRSTSFANNMFDRVIIKMGIHEVQKEDQHKILNEVYRILKSGGKFVTWELSFHDPETQKVFQDLIRKKDQIAGFTTLVTDRYFPRQDELLELFKNAGLKDVTVVHKIDPCLSMRVRESELVSKERRELQEKYGVITSDNETYLAKLGKDRCNELVNFAKMYMKSIPESVKKRLSYKETEDDIKIIPNKEIIVGYKQ